MSKASRPLSEYAEELGDEIVILTSDDKPVAAIVSLKDIDSESWALSTSDVFLELIEKARAEIAMGKSLSLEEMKRAVLP
jgi:antitoxin (DNA-binding transcriptional repressor) of toxin-antitoxin stability system